MKSTENNQIYDVLLANRQTLDDDVSENFEWDDRMLCVEKERHEEK
jgi:hypothetical protein